MKAPYPTFNTYPPLNIGISIDIKHPGSTTGAPLHQTSYFSNPLGGLTSSEFSYAVFPIQKKVQYRVPLSNVGSLKELSLCGWVQHKPVFVTEESSFLSIGDQGQFR